MPLHVSCSGYVTTLKNCRVFTANPSLPYHPLPRYYKSVENGKNVNFLMLNMVGTAVGKIIRSKSNRNNKNKFVSKFVDSANFLRLQILFTDGQVRVQ